MKTLATGSTPLDDDETEDLSDAEAQMTTPGGNKEIKWTVVANAPGLAAAEIIANRLVTEGRLAGKNRNNIGNHAHAGQNHDVNGRMRIDPK